MPPHHVNILEGLKAVHLDQLKVECAKRCSSRRGLPEDETAMIGVLVVDAKHIRTIHSRVLKITRPDETMGVKLIFTLRASRWWPVEVR